MDSPDVPIDRLLTHREWVRALARRLVSDDAAADDLAQDAFVTALEHPPAHGQALRAWFGRVLRSRAADRRRSDGRRETREQATASGREPEDPALAVARTEELSRLVRAILALPEPYRTTVVLHYQEECTVSEVARRMAVPVETVRTRVRRALSRLREALDAEHGGDGRTWTLALLPLVRGWRGVPGGATSVVTKGVIAMTLGSKSKLAALILVLLLVLLGGGVALVEFGGAGGASVAPDAESARGTGGADVPDDAMSGAGLGVRRRDGRSGADAASAAGAPDAEDADTGTGAARDRERAGAARSAGGRAPESAGAGDADRPAETGQTLIVVDDESGAPLADAVAFVITEIAVRNAKEAPAVPRRAPGGAVLHADDAGRIDLPLSRKPGALTGWYVCAPGHAYATHRLGTAKQADATVRLRAGGSLRVHVPRWSELKDAHVFVSSSDAPGFSTAPDPDAVGELVLQGLPLGKIVVVVRLGDWMFEGQELGRGEQLLARGMNDLTVDVHPAEVERVRLLGTLRIPANWKGTRFRLIARGEGKTNPGAFAQVWVEATPGGPATSFALDDLQSGPYGLSILEPAWTTHVNVSSDSARVDLEPPALSEVRVKVIDADTGARIDRASVSLAVKLRENATQPYGIFATKSDAKTGEFVGTFTQDGTLIVSAQGYASRQMPFAPDTSGAVQRIDVALARPGLLVVRTRRGEAEEHVPRLRAHVVPAPGAGVAGSDASEDRSMVFAHGASVRFQLAPGNYTVTLEDPLAPEGTQFPMQEAEVTRGGTAEIVFELDDDR